MMPSSQVGLGAPPSTAGAGAPRAPPPSPAFAGSGNLFSQPNPKVGVRGLPPTPPAFAGSKESIFSTAGGLAQHSATVCSVLLGAAALSSWETNCALLGPHPQVTALTTRECSLASGEVSKRRVDRYKQQHIQPTTKKNTPKLSIALELPTSRPQSRLRAKAGSPRRAHGTMDSGGGQGATGEMGDRGTELAEGVGARAPGQPGSCHPSARPHLHPRPAEPRFTVTIQLPEGRCQHKKMPLPCGLLHHNFY